MPTRRALESLVVITSRSTAWQCQAGLVSPGLREASRGILVLSTKQVALAINSSDPPGYKAFKSCKVIP